MGNTETTTKFSRLKGISSIEDNYLETATGGFLKKVVLKNLAVFTGKKLCWSLFLIKLQAFSPLHLSKRDSNTGVLLCILRIFKSIYFENICERLLLINLLL